MFARRPARPSVFFAAPHSLSLWPSSLSAGRGCGSCSQLSAAARRLLAKTCLAIQGRPSTARPAPQSAATELRLTEAKGTSKCLVLKINKIYQLKNFFILCINLFELKCYKHKRIINTSWQRKLKIVQNLLKLIWAWHIFLAISVIR